MIKKEFHLTHTFKNVSKLEDGKTLYGPEEEHFNIPWSDRKFVSNNLQLFIFRQLSFCRKEEFVGVFLRCLRPTDGIAPWEINADCILKLTSSAGKCLSHSSTYIFQSIGGFGPRKFVSWDTLVKDHLVNDSIIMEATVMITKMTGISKKKLRSFEKSEEQFSDVVLAVEDKKFFVLRKVSVFYAIKKKLSIFFSSSSLPTLHISSLFFSEHSRKLINRRSNLKPSIPSIFRIFWRFCMVNRLSMVKSFKITFCSKHKFKFQMMTWKEFFTWPTCTMYLLQFENAKSF